LNCNALGLGAWLESCWPNYNSWLNCNALGLNEYSVLWSSNYNSWLNCNALGRGRVHHASR